MAKVPVALRLAPEKLARVDAYAKARGRSRQVVLESAVDSFLDDSGRGVPDLVEDTTPTREEQEANKAALKAARVAAQETSQDWAMDRQRRLNADAQRARAKR
jgi:hypothetical protein